MAKATPPTTRCALGGNYVHKYSLDVVADGSEALEPTVFLSVSRRSKNSGDNNNGRETSIEHEDAAGGASCVARYAVLGLSDMTARLVADQKLSWASTKAVFSHNNHRHDAGCCPLVAGVNGGGLWGLPGLLLALNQAGASELTVVTGNSEDASCTEALVQLLEVQKTYPRVRISAVPLTKVEQGAAKWWKMYEDPYLIVHGTCHDRLDHLIYLFTCRRHETVPSYTVAVLPCPHSQQMFLDIWSGTDSRVLLEEDRDGVPVSQVLSIQVVLALGEDIIAKTFRSKVKTLLPEASIFFCTPKQRDSGILLRANESLQAWHSLFPKNILWRQSSSSLSHQCSAVALNSTTLGSCTSVLCRQPATAADRKPAILKRITASTPSDDDVQLLREFFDDSKEEKKGRADANEIDIDDLNDEELDGSIEEKKGSFDTDEIDIDEVNDEELDDGENLVDASLVDVKDGKESRESTEADLRSKKREYKASSATEPEKNDATTTNLNCPHLLVLGTGCASPSPLRGSSGYGMLLPQLLQGTDFTTTVESLILTAIIECGEGTLNALLRHLPSVASTISDSEPVLEIHLRHVKFIWISHAHWDHYGGLPAVLSKIHESRMQHQCTMQKVDHNSSKRSRLESAEPPVLVVAPRKVLDYLNIALGSQTESKHGRDILLTPRLFQGYTHEQSRSWWPPLARTQIARVSSQQANTKPHRSYAYRPFAFWTNVRVEHSCYKAFGFVVGVRVPENDFAGDQCGVGFNSDQPGTMTATLAYSGDTRPCWNFVQRCRIDCSAFSRGVLSCLLHEASFDEAEQAKAVEKKHSSLSEALKVAEDAGAQRVILTHFSQRYAAYPPMKLPAPSNALNEVAAVVFAMDGMLVPFH